MNFYKITNNLFNHKNIFLKLLAQLIYPEQISFSKLLITHNNHELLH